MSAGLPALAPPELSWQEQAARWLDEEVKRLDRLTIHASKLVGRGILPATAPAELMREGITLYGCAKALRAFAAAPAAEREAE